MSYDEAFEELTAFLANCQLQFLYCLKMLRQSKEKILWHLYQGQLMCFLGASKEYLKKKKPTEFIPSEFKDVNDKQTAFEMVMI